MRDEGKPGAASLPSAAPCPCRGSDRSCAGPRSIATTPAATPRGREAPGPACLDFADGGTSPEDLALSPAALAPRTLASSHATLPVVAIAAGIALILLAVAL